LTPTASPMTQRRLNLQIRYNRNLKEYADACRQQGAGTVNPGYVDHALAQLKMSFYDLIEAAKQEGAWTAVNDT
jgi:hypothetical protein